MKISKKIFTTAIIGVFFLLANSSLLLAASSYSAPVPPAPSGVNASGFSLFCSRVGNADSGAQKRLADRLSRIEERRLKQLENLQKRFSERDGKVAAKRAEADGKRVQVIAQLETKAATEVQKQAVAAYQAAIDAAVAARRTAIDQAGKTFREGLKQAVGDRMGTMKTLVEKMKADVDAEYEKAKTGCQNGGDVKALRQALIDGLKNIRQKFISDIKSVEKVIPKIEALKQTRNQAVQKAVDDFKTAAEKAKAELKAAFGQP